MQDEFYKYSYFKPPSEFAVEYLSTSDGMGHQNSADFFIDRNYFNNNLVMYVAKGILHVEQNNRHYKLEAGQYIVMKLTQKHKYYSDAVNPSSVIWFHFKGKEITSLLDRLDKKGKMPLIATSKDCEGKILKMFSVTKNRKIDYEYDLSAQIYSLVLGLIKDSLIMVQNSGDSTLFYFAVDTYIDENISEKLSLEILADTFNMNKYYFCRKFKKHFNNSPMNYINAKRIGIAKNMLDSTNDSLVFIAEQLGFYDQGHFSKTFKSIEGINPLKYKNKG